MQRPEHHSARVARPHGNHRRQRLHLGRKSPNRQAPPPSQAPQRIGTRENTPESAGGNHPVCGGTVHQREWRTRAGQATRQNRASPRQANRPRRGPRRRGRCRTPARHPRHRPNQRPVRRQRGGGGRHRARLDASWRRHPVHRVFVDAGHRQADADRQPRRRHERVGHHCPATFEGPRRLARLDARRV